MAIFNSIRKQMNSEILVIVLPVFLVIGLGFSLKRTELVHSGFIYDLNRLVYYIALPALLFYKIAGADFYASFNARLLGGMVLAISIMFVFSYGFGSLRGYAPATQGAFCQGAFRGNLAYIGLAIIYNAYGEEGFTRAGILLGFLVPYMNVLSVVALILPQRRESLNMGRFLWLQQVATNPLIAASFAGILWSYFGLPLPRIVDRALNIVTGMSLPLALIAIGASFSFQKLRGDLVPAALSAGMKIVLMPAFTALLLLAIGVHGQELAIGVLLAATPTATAAYIMAQQLKCDAELSGAIIMLSTLCSVITYSLALYLLNSMML